MRWKNRPYWIRGGVITIIILAVVIPGLSLLENLSRKPDQEIGVFGILALFIVAPAYLLTDIIGIDYSPTITIATVIAFYLIIGSIIGWLYGKIRNRSIQSAVKY